MVPCISYTSCGFISRCFTKNFFIGAGVCTSNSKRTIWANFRSLNSSSITSNKSSASSSFLSNDAFLVTLKRCADTTSIPGKRSSIFALIKSSMGMNTIFIALSCTTIKRGRLEGIFMKAKLFSLVFLFRNSMANDRL